MFQLLLAIIYLSFISLGLPDSALGSAWPVIYLQLDVPVSYAGIIFMIISGGTILSSLLSDRLTRRLGTGKLTALSVFTTAVALFGFSISTEFWMLILWAIPYGLGAGSVDAALNNYVALHYESWHMSWLHCMWGLGASIGPYIISFALSHQLGWNMGYRYISILQLVLSAILLFHLPLWKQDNTFTEKTPKSAKALSLPEILKISGAKQVLVMFFCYCALEQTAGLWASSYMVLQCRIDPETAAGYASLFFVGITIGRAISGFIAMKLNDNQMIRLGSVIIFIGIVMMCLPLGTFFTLTGLIVIGLGCAPIYPCIIHSTPTNFGEENSSALVGVQMASAYTGNITMAPLFGLIANHISAKLFPLYLMIILVIMITMHKWMLKKVS